MGTIRAERRFRPPIRRRLVTETVRELCWQVEIAPVSPVAVHARYRTASFTPRQIARQLRGTANLSPATVRQLAARVRAVG